MKSPAQTLRGFLRDWLIQRAQGFEAGWSRYAIAFLRDEARELFSQASNEFGPGEKGLLAVALERSHRSLLATRERAALRALLSDKVGRGNEEKAPAGWIDDLLHADAKRPSFAAVLEVNERLADSVGSLLRARDAELADAPSLFTLSIGPSSNRVAPEDLDWILQATRDVSACAIDELCRLTRLDAANVAPWVRALRALCAEPVARVPGVMWREAARDLRGLGFGQILDEKVRLWATGRIVPRGRVVVIEPSKDLRVVPPSPGFGQLSELEAQRMLGAVLMTSLASPGLSIEARVFPSDAARAFGELRGWLCGTEAKIRGDVRLDDRDRERLAQVRRLLNLVRLRLAAVVLSAEGRDASEHVLSALGIEFPRPLASAVTQLVGGAMVNDTRLALGMLFSLRERYDEDWHQNPRVAPLLRGLGERGSLLGVGTVEDELAITRETWREYLKEQVAAAIR